MFVAVIVIGWKGIDYDNGGEHGEPEVRIDTTDLTPDEAAQQGYI